MKETIKSILIGILLFTTGLFYVKWKSCPEVMNHTVQLENTSVPVIRYISRDSIKHVIVEADINKITRDETSEVAAKIKPIIEKLAENLSVAPKQIESSTTISTSTSAKELELQKKVDSLENITYNYKDKYLDVTFIPNIDTNKNPTFNFAYDADLNVTQYWKKKWFLGAKNSYTDISSNDPRTTIRGVKTFTVIQKQPSLGLRIQAVGGYNLNSSNFFGGPSIRFDVKDLSVRGLYSYNTLTKTWSPTVALEYNLIKF